MIFSLREAAVATTGTLHGDAAASFEKVTFDRVTTDSRDIQPGDLFVALKGERFDGHDFAATALAQGAAAVMVDHVIEGAAGNQLLVPDTLQGLTDLAGAWRERMNLTLIGVTGSSGKTTVKELIARILITAYGEEAVLATRGNLNNHIGVPLTLLRLTPEHRFAVIEMGMNHFGEIEHLTQLAKPDVALINNAMRAHLEALGSVEGVARAKGEIFSGLKPHGTAVINIDDAHAELWSNLAAGHRQLSFGIGAADIGAREISSRADGSEFILSVPVDERMAFMPVPGLHNVRNALAAAAACYAAGLNIDQIVSGLAAHTGVKGRLERKAAANGALLIDDTYNANPDSMRAAIDVLALLARNTGQPSLLIIGDMGEVGNDGPAMHTEVGEYAKAQRIDQLFTLGDSMRLAAAAYGSTHYDNLESLLAAVTPAITPDTLVLVKGSRFMQMERVVKALQGAAQDNKNNKEDH